MKSTWYLSGGIRELGWYRIRFTDVCSGGMGSWGEMMILLFCERQQLLRLLIFFAIFSFLCLVSEKSLAIATSVLPNGANSPSIRYGHIEGLDQRYTETGALVRLTDYKAIEFNAKTLAKLNTDAENLIASLNRFGGFKIGDALNLGTLQIETKPQIDYTAAVFAKGFSKSWTLAIAVPAIHYQNQVKLSHSFSNINYYRSQFSGLSDELDAALNTNLGESTQRSLQEKGYKRLDNRDQQFIGDTQLVSLFNLYSNDDISLVHQATLSLPTGPQYDATDLLALNSFHKTNLENTFALSKRFGPAWRVVPYTSVKFSFPEKINARVPSSEDDILPDQTSEESVERVDGEQFELGLQNAFELTDALQISLDYKIGTKSEDRYSGSKSSRYDLLAKNSAARWQKVSFELVYSTIQSYLKQTSKLPFMLSLNFFDTIAGNNIERRVGQEIALTLFF
jgi:hypothetical protein